MVVSVCCSGIEWLSLHKFVSWAHTSLASSGQARGEIVVTDILTGLSTPLSRPDSKSNGETPIETICVSSHKFVVLL